MTENILALPHGTEINHYTIENVLGQGGFGVVYKAHHTHLKETVVIKEFLPVELAGRSQMTVTPHASSKREIYDDCLKRFMLEGRTLVKFRHPNIVRCRDLFTANGTAYLVMDFEDGLPLDVLIKENEKLGEKYNQEQILHFLLPLAHGLAYIHEHGVLHRDIKPANVFIRRADGSPVLIDFGAAKQNFAVASQSKAPYTEFYAPMEQIEGGGEAKPTIDIHAFGGMMYRSVTGEVGPRAEMRTLSIAQKKPDPLKPASVLGEDKYSKEFLNVIDACLAFTPEDRPQTMTDVIAKLSPDANSSVEISRLDDVIEIAGADGHISDSEMTMILSKAQKSGIDELEAKAYVMAKVAEHGWSTEQNNSPEQQQSAENPNENINDVFNGVFGDIFGKKGRDLLYTLTISLDDAFHGGNQSITYQYNKNCSKCKGENTSCNACAGSGSLIKNKTLNVNVPKGAVTGVRLRLENQGDESPNGPSGDLYVEFKVTDPVGFVIDGNDLYKDVIVNKQELANGSTIQIQAYDKKLNVKIPDNYQLGQKVKIKGQGIPNIDSNEPTGDLYLLFEEEATDNVFPKLIERNSPALNDGILTEHIGIETEGGVFTPIAFAGNSIVDGITQIFSTFEDNQSAVTVKLFRGNTEAISEAKFLKKYDLAIELAPKGVPKIEVRIFSDQNNLMFDVKDSSNETASNGKSDSTNATVEQATKGTFFKEVIKAIFVGSLVFSLIVGGIFILSSMG